jgi:hypothetical protein
LGELGAAPVKLLPYKSQLGCEVFDFDRFRHEPYCSNLRPMILPQPRGQVRSSGRPLSRVRAPARRGCSASADVTVAG